MQETKANRVVAAFDFDNTLSTKDILVPFLCYCFGKARVAWGLFCLAPHLALFPLGLCSRQQAKERLLTHFLAGIPVSFLEEKAVAFTQEKLPSLIRQNTVDMLHRHQAEKNLCVLLSANIEPLLLPWASQENFAYVLASRLEVVNGILTGRLVGKNCWGEEKARRLVEALGPKNYTLFAYGDSRGDRELLAMADYKLWI